MNQRWFRVAVVALLALIALQLGAGDAMHRAVLDGWRYVRNIGKPEERPSPAKSPPPGFIPDLTEPPAR